MKHFSYYEIKLANIISQFKELTNETIFISNINEDIVEFNINGAISYITKDYIILNKPHIITNLLLYYYQSIGDEMR